MVARCKIESKKSTHPINGPPFFLIFQTPSLFLSHEASDVLCVMILSSKRPRCWVRRQKICEFPYLQNSIFFFRNQRWHEHKLPKKIPNCKLIFLTLLKRPLMCILCFSKSTIVFSSLTLKKATDFWVMPRSEAITRGSRCSWVLTSSEAMRHSYLW